MHGAFWIKDIKQCIVIICTCHLPLHGVGCRKHYHHVAMNTSNSVCENTRILLKPRGTELPSSYSSNILYCAIFCPQRYALKMKTYKPLEMPIKLTTYHPDIFIQSVTIKVTIKVIFSRIEGHLVMFENAALQGLPHLYYKLHTGIF